MRKWAWAVISLYLATLAALTTPLFLVHWPERGTATSDTVLAVYESWQYWVWIALMLLGEFLLLIPHVRKAEGRLKSRRPVLIAIITSGFFFGVLMLCVVWSIFFALWGDGDSPPLRNGTPVLVGHIVALVSLWVAWGVLFRRFSRSDTPDALARRAVEWLLNGSILELLVAVPSHVIVRRRGDCCAPFGTFIAIAAGISIMLMSFGPGVFWLFVQRLRRLRPSSDPGDVP